MLFACGSHTNNRLQFTYDNSINNKTQSQFEDYISSYLDRKAEGNINFYKGSLAKADLAYRLDLFIEDTMYLDEKFKYYYFLSSDLSEAVFEGLPVSIHLKLPNTKEIVTSSSDSLVLESTLFFQDVKYDITAIHPLKDVHCDAVTNQLRYLWNYIGNRPDSAHIKISKHQGAYYLDIPYNEKYPLEGKGQKFFHLTANYISDSVFNHRKTMIRLYNEDGDFNHVFENNNVNYVIE